MVYRVFENESMLLLEGFTLFYTNLTRPEVYELY